MIGAIPSLESLAAAVPERFETDGTERPLPPVETWNPPDRGEIAMRIARDGTSARRSDLIFVDLRAPAPSKFPFRQARRRRR